MFGEILICCLIVVKFTFGQPDPLPEEIPLPDLMTNDPLGEGPYDLVSGESLQYEETKWVQIPLNHETCRLNASNNWPFENHYDIAYEDPPARPRYYIIKKRRASNNKVQFVALQNPEAVMIQPDVFRRQLMTIFCEHGKVELIKNRVRHGAGGGPFQREAQNCDIEERLVALCFQDPDVGSLADFASVFQPQIPNTNVEETSFNTARQLADNSHKVSVVQVPGRLSQPIMEGIFTYLFRGANRANFNRVAVSGFGVNNNCVPNVVTWGAFEINHWLNALNANGQENFARRHDLYRLYQQSTQEPLQRFWVFCLS